MSNKAFVRYLWLTIAAVSFALGTAGILLPLLPTVPFYMLTVLCLAKGSERLHKKFIESSLYQKNVAEFSKTRSMPIRTKVRIMCVVTFLMSAGAYFMREHAVALAVMGGVWIAHLVALTFFVKSSVRKADGTDGSDM